MVPRQLERSRFAGNPVFQHLEKYWEEPQPYLAQTTLSQSTGTDQKLCSVEVSSHIRVVTCANPQDESRMAAREILRFVRSGGRFRESTVLVRKLNEYVEPLQAIFTRFQIPFFMDRREPVSHHPLPELTRNALRTIVFGWLHDDWFAALKTGLVSADEREIDRLENEALARGWKGNTWQKPILVQGQPELTQWLSELHWRVLPPFQQLAVALGATPSGPTGLELAQALRSFWETLRVEQLLQSWADHEPVNRQDGKAGSVHSTVWEAMNELLTNVELAFAKVALPLRDWLQILEAGLGSLTVGVVPPALDQVLVGAIDRSRNPEIKLALVLGLNEGVFPARPETSVLLNEADRAELEKHGVTLSLSSRQQLGQERFFSYIALTRASELLFLSSALQDSNGAPLNPSPFLRHLTRLFPGLHLDDRHEKLDWRNSEHPSELIGKLLSFQASQSRPVSHEPGMEGASSSPALSSSGGEGEKLRFDGSGVQSAKFPLGISLPAQLETIPGLSAVIERLSHFQQVKLEGSLNPDLTERLFGQKLRTSVSRLEQFAACPFKFFVHSGLKAEERRIFELDAKEQGLFQHDLLALFHEQLRREGKRWRDITGKQARDLLAQLAEGLAETYREGLLHASQRSKFMLLLITESLQDFIETSVNWMREQYQFDPVAVEVPFGEAHLGEAWELDLNNGHSLILQGRIDRIDVSYDSKSSSAQCVVVDYKSGQKRLDPVLLANGLQLQLLTYLSVVKRWRNPGELAGGRILEPGGVFYVSLRGQYDVDRDRRTALSEVNEARQTAYQHSGRFNANILRLLDSRSNARVGNQFNYRLRNDGNLAMTCREALPREAFNELLDSIEVQLKRIGQQIFSGTTDVAPYKRGSVTACQQCVYGGICRIDPWTHRYRVLNRNGAASEQVP
jgi:ATP-dependent helicase/nuclease subunit B